MYRDQIRRRHIRFSAVAFITVIVAMVVVACRPTPPTATPRPTSTAVVLYVTRLVTLTPSSTLTLTPTMTLPYDIQPVEGNWILDLSYTLRGIGRFSDLRYLGSAALTVDLNGNVFGSVELYGAVPEARCREAILDPEPMRATVRGALRLADDGSTMGDLTIVPADPLAKTSLWLLCPGDSGVSTTETSLLWPAVGKTGGLTLTIPFQASYRRTFTVDLVGPTQGGLRGSLISQLSLGR